MAEIPNPESGPPKNPSDWLKDIREHLEAEMPRDADENIVMETLDMGDGKKLPMVKDPSDPTGKRLIPGRGPIHEPPEQPTPEKPKAEMTSPEEPKPRSRKKKNTHKQTDFIGEFDASEQAYRKTQEASTPPPPPVVPKPEFYISKEASIEEMHKTYKAKRSEKPFVKQPFIKEVMRDEEREYRELAKALGWPTAAEKLRKIRMVVAPYELYLWRKAGIIDLLNKPMSADFVDELQKKIPILEELAKTPKAKRRLEKLQGNFRYWKYLTRLYKENPRREYTIPRK